MFTWQQTRNDTLMERERNRKFQGFELRCTGCGAAAVGLRCHRDRGTDNSGVTDCLESSVEEDQGQCSSCLTFNTTKRVLEYTPWIRRSQVLRVGVLGATLMRDWFSQTPVSPR